MDDKNLLSFVVTETTGSEFVPVDLGLEPGSIWDKLHKAIAAQIKKDGFKKSALLPGESVKQGIQDAAEVLYYDVAEFYYWYFDNDDDRTATMRHQKIATILSPLRAAVKPVVEQNLEYMKEAETLPEDLDYSGLVETITDNLTRYILNWQDWYYERKAQEDQEDRDWDRAIWEDIYVDSTYGDLTNLGNFDDADEEE